MRSAAFPPLTELDAALSSVSVQADAIRAGMKTAEKRMKELQKLIEYGKNYTEYKPIHDELKKLQNGWTEQAGQVRGSPPRRAYAMERGEPLSPCKSAERDKDLAYL